MSELGLNHVMEILRGLYDRVQTLQQFSSEVEFSGGGKPVVQHERDSERLKVQLEGLILATLPEVLAFVLNQMKIRKKRNVLSFGYQFSTGRSDLDYFKFHGSISQSAAFICGSEVWMKINNRLGTELTQYLLTHCAIFTTAPPTCLVQICGVPVYDLVPLHTWSGFFLSSTDRLITMNKNQRTAIKTRVGGGAKNRQRREANAKHSKITGSAKKRKREGNEVKDNREMQDDPLAKKNCIEVIPYDSDMGNITENTHLGQPQLLHISPASKHGLSSWKPSQQAPPHTSYCFISIQSMLYGGHGMKSFMLNRKLHGVLGEARSIQGTDVVRMVFCLKDKRQGSNSHKLPKRFFGMVPIFSLLLHQHRKCPYVHFLSQKCAINKGKGGLASLLSSHCSSFRVYLFIRECVRFVIPEELWGSRNNMIQFLSRVKQFLRLGKFEKLSLAQVMWKIRVTDCRWLGQKKCNCPSEHRYREWILGQFLFWVLKDFVIGLVKALFYVTESVGHKHMLRFYRRRIWTRLQDQVFREHLSKGLWEELSPAEVAALPKERPTSHIRFIPKPNGIRPITRLINTAAALQFQSSVRNLQSVLNACVREQPNLLGSTVWGQQDIHKLLSAIPLKDTPLYFVKVDVSGAYDSLPHCKLLEVVQDVLKPVEDICFSLRHYAKLCRDSGQEIATHFCTRADLSESLNMKRYVMEEQNNGKLHNAILVEKLWVQVKGMDMFQFFKKMLNTCIIRYDKRVFRQVCGVPQGCAVATMLCNLCYGHMENSVLKNMTDKGGCMMRLVDDFLLITPKLSKALDFLKTLMAGVPDYGCVINPQKVAVNFPLCENLKYLEMMEFPAHCMFPWCGLLIDTRTLHVSNDYSRYAGQSLHYSLTLDLTDSPAVFMRKKLLKVMWLKCNCILLDVHLNSIEVVYRNIYKLFLLQAMRFHVCVKSLPLGQGVWTNTRFFLKMIWSMVKITHKKIKKSNSGLCVDDVFQYKAVELLCCLAFGVILKRHRSSYHCLLPHIHIWRRYLLSELHGIRLAQVFQAATPRIPPDFTSICT